MYYAPTPGVLAELQRASTGTDPWPVFGRSRPDRRAPDWQLDGLRSLLGGELTQRTPHEFPAPIMEYVLERWVYDRMLDDPALATRGIRVVGDDTGTRQW